MRYVADRPGLAAGLVTGSDSVELLVDLLLLHRLAQLPVLLDGHDHRYYALGQSGGCSTNRPMRPTGDEFISGPGAWA